MLKKIVSLMLVSIMVMLPLVGCQSQNSNTQKSGKVGGKISWLTASNAVQLKDYQSIFAEFTKDTGIKSNVMGVPYEQLYPKLQTMIASNQTPEINSWGTEFVPWASRGAMTPLDSYISKDNFDMSQFNQKMVDSLKWNGKTWSIPTSMGTCVLFYNKDLFQKAGVTAPTHDWNNTDWTTDAFIKMAQELTLDKNGKNALDPNFDKNNIVQYGVGGMQGWWFAPWYFGGDWTDDNVTKYTGDQEGAVKGLQFESDLINKYHVEPSAQQTLSLAAGGNIFMTGKVAMQIDGNWGCTTLLDAKFKWDIAATPIGTNHSIVLFTDGFGIGGKSENPDGGWEYIKWLYSDTQHYDEFLKASNAYMTIPALQSYQDKLKVILKGQYSGVDFDVMFNAVNDKDAKPVHMRYNANFNKLNEFINQQAITPVLAGEITAQKALSAIKDNANSIINTK